MLNKHIDKVAHLFVSYFLLTAFSLVLPLWGAILATLIIGLGKEIYDKRFDYKDLIADIIGIIIGIAYVILSK